MRYRIKDADYARDMTVQRLRERRKRPGLTFGPVPSPPYATAVVRNTACYTQTLETVEPDGCNSLQVELVFRAARHFHQ